MAKKLSEITDLAHRYLIIPTHQRDPTNDYQQSEPEVAPNEPPREALAPTRFEAESQDSSASDKSSIGLRDETGQAPQSSALTAAWIQASNQQQQASSKSRGYLQQNATDLSSLKIRGYNSANEVTVSDTLTTDFPNPNINNLGHEITKILTKFFIHGYDKRVRPNYSGPPALVNVSFHIIGISSVDEVQMDFTTDFYFRQKWYDPRLEFSPVGDVDELCVGAEFAEKIWLPDTFFANEKTATFHKATTENTFIRIAHTGRVYRSIRLTVTCSCPMDLQYFPMDRQRCKIEIESYGYNTKDIDYRWEKGDASVTLNNKIELPQFKILGFKMGHELQNLSSGDYIRLYCEIHFVRSMGYYLIQIYIPASLIVIISWVSFWLHRNATPARVALGVTTVLTMTTLMSSTNAALPKISYIKSIDVFLGTCFVMVFASLLEYASVGYIGKRIAMKRKRLQDLQQMQQHHQKVCVAAAASAAAAASTPASGLVPPSPQQLGQLNRQLEQGTNKDPGLMFPPPPPLPPIGASQTLNRPGASQQIAKAMNGSKTIQRKVRGSAAGGQQQQANQHEQEHGFKRFRMLAGSRHQVTSSEPAEQQQLLTGYMGQQKVAPLSVGAALAAAANQTAHSTTTEFEVSQTHDMITICGLTPSAIDKHSRVVFPICFVCFNLMYWIIYGHISQQTDDKGPPLNPFIKG